jgi:hypothetical protein
MFLMDGDYYLDLTRTKHPHSNCACVFAPFIESEGESMKERRLRKYGATFELLIEFMREGWVGDHISCITGIPQDAVLVDSYKDVNSGIIWFVFYHESFDVVRLGEVMPEGQCIYKKEHKQEGDLVDERTISCACGQQIGHYVEVGQQVWLQVGPVRVQFLSGECSECGVKYEWTATSRAIEKLIARRERLLAEN